MMHTLPELLTVSEAAAILRVTPKTVRRYIDQRELAAVRRPGCKVLVPRDSIRAYQDRYLCPANAELTSNRGSATSPAGASSTSSGHRSENKAASAAARASKVTRGIRPPKR